MGPNAFLSCNSQRNKEWPSGLWMLRPNTARMNMAMDSASPWKKPSVANPVRYKPSGVHFARVQVGDKLIRELLKAEVLSAAQLRLGGLVKEERSTLEARTEATKWKMIFGDALAIYRQSALPSGQLLLRLLRHVQLRCADILDFDGRGAINVHVVVVEGHLALHLELELRERAVLEPELHGPFGIADGRAVAAQGRDRTR